MMCPAKFGMVYLREKPSEMPSEFLTWAFKWTETKVSLKQKFSFNLITF